MPATTAKPPLDAVTESSRVTIGAEGWTGRWRRMPRPTPTQAVLIAIALTTVLLAYVFGVPAVLRGVIWVAVGAVVGWLGSLIVATATQHGILLNILAGAVGALAGLLLLGAPISGGGPLEQFLAAIVGSVLVVAAAGAARGWRSKRRALPEMQAAR